MASCDNNSVILDLMLIPTYSLQTLAIADLSFYPQQFNISTPTLQITPPAFPTVTISFVPGDLMIFNSNILCITCTAEGNCLTDLPDGIYKLNYSVAPAYQYHVEKSFLRVDKLYSMLDEAYMKLDLFHCDGMIKNQERKILDEVEAYIEGAISASNQCALKLATDLYNKASNILGCYLSDACCKST